MNVHIVLRAFNEGVKRAFQIISRGPVNAKELAKAGDAVRKAMERAVKAAAKAKVK